MVQRGLMRLSGMSVNAKKCQLVAICNQRVGGSNPSAGSNKNKTLHAFSILDLAVTPFCHS